MKHGDPIVIAPIYEIPPLEHTESLPQCSFERTAIARCTFGPTNSNPRCNRGENLHLTVRIFSIGRVDRSRRSNVGVRRRTVHQRGNLLSRREGGFGLLGPGKAQQDDEVGKPTSCSDVTRCRRWWCWDVSVVSRQFSSSSLSFLPWPPAQPFYHTGAVCVVFMVVASTFYSNNRRYLPRYYSKVGWIMTSCPYSPLLFRRCLFSRDLVLAATNKTSSSCFTVLLAIVYVSFVVINQPAIGISHHRIPAHVLIKEMVLIATQIDLDGSDIVWLDLGKKMRGRRSGNGWLCDQGET